MSGKGKRRSARLLKLEEQKNDDDSTVCLLDPWQIIRNSISGSSARGRRKRNDELQQAQGEASCSHQPLPADNSSNNSSSQSSVGQIIECILNELEMRDRHELFAMPDDIQVTDYAERVNRPGDFATLRQKNKDGMYMAMEHFESDVYMVFQKAMTMNSQDTVPFREAMSLLNQAKHMFMSLKNNQMYSESEIAAWRQRHLDQQLHQPITPGRREGGEVGVPPRRAAAAPRKKGAAEKKTQANGKNVVVGDSVDDQCARQGGGGKQTKGTPPGKKMRKGVDDAGVAVRRRLTYTDDDKAGGDQTWRAMEMPALQGGQVTLQDQLQEHAYRESLQRFVRHAGLKARVAAEFRSLECAARDRHSPTAQYWNPGAGFLLPHGYHHQAPTQRSLPGATNPALRTLQPSADHAVLPTCRLETDELLKLFVLMATPDAFLERAKQVFGDDNKRKEGATKGMRKAKAADQAETGATAPKAATDHAKTGATATKAADHAKTTCTAAAKSADHAKTTGAAAAKAVDHAKTTGATAAEAADHAKTGATAAKSTDHAKRGATAAKAAHHAKTGATAAKAADHAKTGATAAKSADHAKTGAAAAKAADHARTSAAAAKAADHAKAGATAAQESGQNSSAREPAAAPYGPFAPPKLLPGRLGFGQFASSSSQPFKVKPSPTSIASGKKKIS